MRLNGQPVWASGERPTLHDIVALEGTFGWIGGSRCVLRVACCSVYRAWLNGEFVAFGPARCAKGHFRVDEIDLAGRVRQGENRLRIEVVHYGANGYSAIDQPPFVLAEVIVDGKPVLWTGPKDGGFTPYEVEERLRRVARYSFQRPFSEAYHLGVNAQPKKIAGLQLADAGVFLPRRSPIPAFRLRQPTMHVANGRINPKVNPAIRRDGSLTGIGPALKGYREEELAAKPQLELQGYDFEHEAVVGGYDPLEPLQRVARTTAMVDFGLNGTGFIGATLKADSRCRLVLVFDEILSGGKVDFARLGCANAIQIELEPGEHRFESAEPYTLRYLEAVVLEGECEITELSLRELAHPNAGRARFACADPRLNRIYRAAIETLRANAVDIFMDCPSRERAGWLCDSYFTARALHLTTGDTDVEHDFLENFALPERFDNLPEGMVAMCYPADHNNGVFIPQWSMWLVLQTEEYLARSGDAALVAKMKRTIDGLLGFYRKYENADGLLEKLPSWNFIEWSKANDWVQDVSYPTNMLYSGTLDAASRLLGRPELHEKAEKVRRAVHEQSYDGVFFVDNAKREDGKLKPTGNRSEVCQYFAFFFGVANRENDPDLWRRLFGGEERTSDLAAANMFVGEVMRMDLQAKAGNDQQTCDDMVRYLLKMADTTGTLWENNNLSASADHGFASHAVVWLFGQALGVRRVDTVKKEVTFRMPMNALQWCEGALPTPDGPIEVSWWREGEALAKEIRLPAGYRLVQAQDTSPWLLWPFGPLTNV